MDFTSGGREVKNCLVAWKKVFGAFTIVSPLLSY